MIDRQRGKIVFSCDACGEALETDTDDFTEANVQRRDAGWQAWKEVEGEWVHFCSERCAR